MHKEICVTWDTVPPYDCPRNDSYFTKVQALQGVKRKLFIPDTYLQPLLGIT